MSFRKYPDIYLKIDLSEGGCVSSTIQVDFCLKLLEVFSSDGGVNLDDGTFLRKFEKKYVRCVFDDPNPIKGKLIGIGHIFKDKWMLF
jgi:hypothetical protein